MSATHTNSLNGHHTFHENEPCLQLDFAVAAFRSQQGRINGRSLVIRTVYPSWWEIETALAQAQGCINRVLAVGETAETSTACSVGRKTAEAVISLAVVGSSNPSFLPFRVWGNCQ